jgi:hypothetical protein
MGHEVEWLPPATDEYDCLIGPLLVRLGRRDGRADLSQYLWDEIENHFKLDPVRVGCLPYMPVLLGLAGVLFARIVVRRLA